MADGDANKNTATPTTNDDAAAEAELDRLMDEAQAAAADPDAPDPNAEPPKPVEQVKVKSKKDPGVDIPVTIEETKRRKLNNILELMKDFTPKEVKAIVKLDKRRRKVEKLEGKSAVEIGGILGK